MTPQAFLANAERILVDSENQPDACASRAIVHAAYYAVFHYVALKLNVSVEGVGGAKHNEIGSLLRSYPGTDPVIYEAKLVFQNLLRARVDADYFLAKTVDAKTARDAVNWGSDVFAAGGIVELKVV